MQFQRKQEEKEFNNLDLNSSNQSPRPQKSQP